MEIVHIVLGKANPDRMNGVNKVVYQLATRQAASGRKVSVWGMTRDTTHNYGDRNFETRLYKSYRNPFQIDPTIIEDIRASKGKAVFHLHGGWIPAFHSLSQALSQHDVPFVLTAHGAYNTVAMRRSNVTKKIYFSLFEKKVLSRANAVHCIGESEVAGLKSIHSSANSFLLPYGFEMPDAAGDRLLHKKEFIVGFVGRIDIYTKGLDLILKSFQDLANRYDNARLWIIGDGPERSKLEQMIQDERMESKVILWGSRFGEEKNALIRQMDVFVHPSRNEGLPSAVLEAASFGVPSIVSVATNVGGAVKRYNAGSVIDNESASQLSEALHHAYLRKGTAEEEAMAANSLDMVEQAFNWEKIVSDFDQLYRIKK